jgi:hypothetical protein
MGKRSSFPRLVGDRYLTIDPDPVRRLQPFLLPRMSYAEPCAGKGDMIRHMEFYGHQCVYSCDIRPGRGVEKRDAFDLDRRWRRQVRAQMFITNLPWTREILHPMIDHLTKLLPLWTILDADWAHTRQAVSYIDRCARIVSLGRVQWMPGTTGAGFENCAWYFFPSEPHRGGPIFTGLT